MEANLGMMGNQTPFSGGRQGERLTDERDKTELREGERAPQKGLGDQRGTPSKIMTIRRSEERERGACSLSHTLHLKKTFIPHTKGGSGDELS